MRAVRRPCEALGSKLICAAINSFAARRRFRRPQRD
jgi:hypothetical protein